MFVVSLPYSASQARDLAAALSQIIPVLLLAALAVPLLQRTEPVEKEPTDARKAQLRWRAVRHLMATIAVLGLSALAEYGALYGVYFRLTHRDVVFEVTVFALTSLAAFGRVLMPILEHYADALNWRELNLWFCTVVGAIVVFFAALYGLGR